MATPALKAKELGNKAYKAKQFDTAIKHYDEAIALDPTDITFYNNKGGLCTDFIVPSCYFGSDLSSYRKLIIVLSLSMTKFVWFSF